MKSGASKSNSVRKVLTFYRVHFALSPPFAVLCDPHIVHRSLAEDIYLKVGLRTLFGAPAFPAVTKCVVAELRSRGEEYTNATLFARRLPHLPCTHEQEKCSAIECIQARLASPYEKSVIVAAADEELLKKLAFIPGALCVQISTGPKLVIRRPSQHAVNHVRDQKNTTDVGLSEADKQMIQKVQADQQAEKALRKPLTRKRSRPKGPNPLSMKKSKKVSHASGAASSSRKQIVSTTFPLTSDEPTKSMMTELSSSKSDAQPVKMISAEDNRQSRGARRRKRKRYSSNQTTCGEQVDNDAEVQVGKDCSADLRVARNEEPAHPPRKRKRRVMGTATTDIGEEAHLSRANNSPSPIISREPEKANPATVGTSNQMHGPTSVRLKSDKQSDSETQPLNQLARPQNESTTAGETAPQEKPDSLSEICGTTIESTAVAASSREKEGRDSLDSVGQGTAKVQKKKQRKNRRRHVKKTPSVGGNSVAKKPE